MTKRFATLLPAIFVSILSVSWVIKDTANPVQIYTGSNTSPSMSVATDGSVSFVGAIKQAICSKSADYTVTNVDGCDSIFVTTAGTDRTITLPSAATNAGRRIVITKSDSGTGMVLVSGAVKSPFASIQYDRVAIQSDGSVWYPETISTGYRQFTPTSWTGVTNINTQVWIWKRHGPEMEIKGFVKLSGAVTASIGFPLPTGYTIDVTAATPDPTNYGIATILVSGSNYSFGTATYASTTSIRFMGQSTLQFSATVPHTWATNDVLSFTVFIPISGW